MFNAMLGLKWLLARASQLSQGEGKNFKLFLSSFAQLRVLETCYARSPGSADRTRASRVDNRGKIFDNSFSNFYLLLKILQFNACLIIGYEK